MTAKITPFRPRPSNRPHDPAIKAKLARFRELGMAAVRTAGELSNRLASPALHAVGPGDGKADVRAMTEAARNAQVARLAGIVDGFDKAGRAVRLTILLQLRLDTGLRFGEYVPPKAPRANRSGPEHDRDDDDGDDDEDYEDEEDEDEDDEEDEDEIEMMTDQQVFREIRRELSEAAAILSRLAKEEVADRRSAPRSP